MTGLPESVLAAIKDRLRHGWTHRDIAEDLHIKRHIVSRTAREHGFSTRNAHLKVPHRFPWQRPRDLDWMEYAQCRGWTTPDGRDFTDAYVHEQLPVCEGCPVACDCREYALAGPPVYVGQKATDGVVYGGLPPRELARLQRRRTRELAS